MRKTIKSLIMSMVLYSTSIFVLAEHAVADDAVSPYGVHEPVRTGITDNVIVYVIAIGSFIFGLSIIIYAYYLKNKMFPDD